MKKEINKLEHNAAAIKRWRSRLKRAMSMLDKLERQRRRLETKARDDLAIAPPGSKRPEPKSVTVSLPARHLHAAPAPAAVPAPVADDLVIPTFLKRTPDPVAEQIRTEQAEAKQAKTRGRIEKMKAKARGDLKRMPLTGKAALEAIRNG
jgi:hypothetical protein